MRFMGYTLPVNPSDASVRLTKEQLYESLKIKARDPMYVFTPDISICALTLGAFHVVATCP